MAIVAIALNMAKEAEISVDINRAYSNRRSKENKYYNSISTTVVDCYELRLKVLSDRTTLVLSNTRELNRVPKTK